MVFHRNVCWVLKDRMVLLHDDADMAFTQQIVVQVFYIAQTLDPVGMRFHEKNDAEIRTTALYIVKDIIKRLLFQTNIYRSPMPI